MSHCKNKGADQLRCDHAPDHMMMFSRWGISNNEYEIGMQILAVRVHVVSKIVQSLIFQLLYFYLY